MEHSQGAKKILLVPIATIGCGKTTVGHAMTLLYGERMGHIQSDEIPASKNKKRQFTERTKQLLAQHEIVMMDRNNAEKREREQIFKDLAAERDHVLFVAMNFLPSGPMQETRRLTRSLVKQRKSHMTIRDMPESKIEMIMATHEKRFQKLDTKTQPDAKYDSVVDLVAGNSLQNVKTTIAALENLGVAAGFSEAEIVAAYEAALKYEPKFIDVSERADTAEPHGNTQ